MKATIRRYCRYCRQKRPFEKERCNNTFHLLMTVLTAGLWLPLWILAGIASMLTLWRCKECGAGK